LAAVDKGLEALLDMFEIVGTAPGRVADIVGQLCGFLGSAFQRADDIDPVQGVQVIEMNDVVVLELRTMQQVADEARIFGNLTPTASSTALTEDRAWVYVQTPQERCTK
jgi:hypothetical protein